MKPQPLPTHHPGHPESTIWTADEIKAACEWTLGELLVRGEYNYSQVEYIIEKAFSPVYQNSTQHKSGNELDEKAEDGLDDKRKKSEICEVEAMNNQQQFIKSDSRKDGTYNYIPKKYKAYPAGVKSK